MDPSNAGPEPEKREKSKQPRQYAADMITSRRSNWDKRVRLIAEALNENSDHGQEGEVLQDHRDPPSTADSPSSPKSSSSRPSQVQATKPESLPLAAPPMTVPDEVLVKLQQQVVDLTDQVGRLTNQTPKIGENDKVQQEVDRLKSYVTKLEQDKQHYEGQALLSQQREQQRLDSLISERERLVAERPRSPRRCVHTHPRPRESMSQLKERKSITTLQRIIAYIADDHSDTYWVLSIVWTNDRIPSNRRRYY